MGTLYNPEYNLDLTTLSITDIGDINHNETLEQAHIQLYEKVKLCLLNQCIPFIIGGSNDQSYPNAKAFMNVKNGKVNK
jgi:formiminoglutamase